MATITLTALPACFERHATRCHTTKVTELLGTCLGQGGGQAKSLDDVRRLVACFGQGIAARHPAHSFTVLVSVAKVRASRTASTPPAATTASGRRAG